MRERAIAVIECGQHPASICWPWRNLIEGMCPDCGCRVEDADGVVRALRAKRLLEENDGAVPDAPHVRTMPARRAQ